MKVYSISTPKQLERAADLVKWPKDREKVMKFAGRWYNYSMKIDVTLEIGRNAIIHYIDLDGKKTKLVNLYVIPARQFAGEELTEI